MGGSWRSATGAGSGRRWGFWPCRCRLHRRRARSGARRTVTGLDEGPLWRMLSVSEYQYYEFVAVDRPLTSVQQGEVRALSTRARITASSFVNTYEWGDFKGDPHALMERYYDAFLYLANWGTRRVMLRVPIGLLDLDTAAVYCVGDSARAWATRERVILDLSSEDEEADWEHDGEGWLASILPARTELAAGDTRLLDLAWLPCRPGREGGEARGGPPR